MITLEEVTGLRDKVETELKARFPFFRTNISTLGGVDRASIMITFSLDARETWAGGIKENSRYFNVHIHNTRTSYEVENYISPRGLKMRSFKTMNLDEVVVKLNRFYDKLTPLI